jgi:hypothetical protein
VNLSFILLNFVAAITVIGLLLVIAFYTLVALSGAGETNDGEIEPPAHPSAPASTRPDQEAAL